MAVSVLPQPWLVCLLIAAVPVLLVKVLPPVARAVGRGMSASAQPVATALVLPEFWVTTLIRKQGRRVPGIVHGYDRCVEVVFRGLHAGGAWTRGALGRTRRLHVLYVVAPVLALVAVWYVEPRLPPSSARMHLVAFKCGLLRTGALLTPVDGWSRDGGACPVPPPSVPVGPDIPSGSPYGRLDAAGRAAGSVVVSGWAVEPSSPTSPVTVHAQVDALQASAAARRGVTDQPRPDVTARLSLPPTTGFRIAVPVTGGDHEVCVYAINGGAGVTTSLGCTVVP